MKTCTFFGQRFVSKRVEKDVRTAIVQMIEKDRVELFLVGNEGGFNKMVQRLLKELEESYPNIRYGLVFACRHKKEKSSHCSRKDFDCLGMGFVHCINSGWEPNSIFD